jgi:N-acetylmuramoyl-L-alanine amidase
MFSFLINIFMFDKRKKYKLLVFVLISLFSLQIFCQENNGYKLKTVVIDPGHGGKDSGASGKKGKEKDIVLSIALKTGKYIEENIPNVRVIYTRETDVFIPLHERANIANSNNADLFISIHVNSNPSSKPYGTETFAMGLHKSKENLQVAQLENSAILKEDNYIENYGGFDPESAESYIIFSLLQNSYMDQSINFASFIQSEFREKVKRKDRGVKQAGFLVLWKTTMPSVLIEAGFISNTKEEAYLLSDKGQVYISSAIYRAFKSYKIAYEAANEMLVETISRQETKIDSAAVAKEVAKTPAEPEIKTNNIIRFKIQVSSSKTSIPANDSFFKDLEDVQEIKYFGLYKYAVGNSTDFNEIVKLKNEIKTYFPDAFVIAMKGDKIIPLNEAIIELKEKK